jgi:hypothetical protein
MTQSPTTKKQTTNQPPVSMTNAAILLLLTIADTTWRAFVPTIGGTVLGVVLDNMLGVAPVMTIILIIVGFATSGILIALQIRKIRKGMMS